MRYLCSLVFVALVAAACGGAANDTARGDVKTAADAPFDPEATQKIEASVIAHVEKEYRWMRDAYWIESPRRTSDGAVMVRVVHRDDAAPGARGSTGKTLQLVLNGTTFAVERAAQQ